MKRILSSLLALATAAGIATAARAESEPAAAPLETVVAAVVAESAGNPDTEEQNYLLLMQEAAQRGDEASLAEGAALEARRNLKITVLDLGYEPTDFFSSGAAAADIAAAIDAYLAPPEPVYTYTEEDLYWLAMAITREAGSGWLSDEHQLLVGNVVLNRVASSRFPDTIYGVLHQKGQYPWAYRGRYTTPTERAYANAERLLKGERFCPDDVLFSAQKKHGWGVFKAITDPMRGTTTYFCHGYP